METNIQVFGTDLLANKVVELNTLDITVTKDGVEMAIVTECVSGSGLNISEERGKNALRNKCSCVGLFHFRGDLSRERTDRGKRLRCARTATTKPTASATGIGLAIATGHFCKKCCMTTVMGMSPIQIVSNGRGQTSGHEGCNHVATNAVIL